jgi:adsorption protein A
MNDTSRVLCLCIALAMHPVAARAAASQPESDLGAFARFRINPHLDRGFAAMRVGDEHTAISEFQRARALAPRDAQVALYLAEAYRRFGHPREADAVIAEQRRYTPDDPRLQSPVHRATAAGLATAQPAAADDCRRVRTPACRARIGMEAIEAGKLARAEAQLDAPDFARSADGLALRRNLAQRAIYLHDWTTADRQFARLDQGDALGPDERVQWFNTLLTQGRVDRARALLGQPGTDGAAQELALAQALSRAHDGAALARFLADRAPAFADAGQERQWLAFLQQAARVRGAPLERYRVRFPQNRKLQADAAVPLLLARDDVEGAQRMLRELPPDAQPDARFELALRAHDLAAAQHYAAAMVARRNGDPSALDTLSYRLVEAGGDAQAARLLLDAYPWHGDTSAALLQRLAVIAAHQPDAFDANDRQRLQSPLPLPTLRESQATVLAALGDCDGVTHVLGDLDAHYDADSWARLGDCYRTAKPALAQYAYAAANQRRPSAAMTRAVAYQAYAAGDYSAGLAAWSSLPDATLAPEDLVAAATTAAAAGQRAKPWLDLYASRGGRQDDAYWWLRAGDDRDDPAAAQVDLRNALAVREDPRYLVQLARLQAKAGQPAQATASLERAVALAPDDAAARAELGYAYWDAGEPAKALPQLERAHAAMPANQALVRQLVYVQQRLGDRAQARRYAEMAIDGIEQTPATADAAADTDLFGFRRLHEDLGRRWRFSGDLLVGTHATSSANTVTAASYRSYSQVQLDYRLGDRLGTSDPETLAVYGRVFAGSGDEGSMLPFHAPTLGVGLRWKPIASQVIFLAVEQQEPLNDRGDRRSDTLLRASASFLTDGSYGDDWHPAGSGWLAQNLYFDVARYLRSDQTLLTAMYVAGWHRKLSDGQTLEPYGRLEYSAIDDDSGSGYRHDLRAGVGLRWNRWYGQDRYNAYRHRFTIGLEWQHAFNTYLADRNGAFLVAGVSW